MQLETGNIVKFLQTAYTDENLAALLAHAQDGKLSFYSCCCVAGIPSAGHALKESSEYDGGEHEPYHPMSLPYPECQLADRVSEEFRLLGEGDVERRAAIIPLIRAEQDRRAQSSTNVLDAAETAEVA